MLFHNNQILQAIWNLAFPVHFAIMKNKELSGHNVFKIIATENI